MNELAALKATVYGRVQGVFFRAFVKHHAEGLGLTGYVRNTPQGEVEVYAEGSKEQLEKLVGHLKNGPTAARVDRVVTGWLEYTGKYADFHIQYS